MREISSPAPPLGVRSIAANASYMFVARTGAQILRALYVIVLARAFGPDLYGLLTYGQSWIGVFVPLTALGFGIVLAREAGRDPARCLDQAAHMFGVRACLVLAGAALCVGIGWAVNADPLMRILIGILTLALIGRAAAILAEDIFAAFELSYLIFRQEALFRPAEIAFGLVILAAGGGVIEIAALHAAAQILQGGRSLILARRYVPFHSAAITWRPALRLLVRGALAGGAGLLSVWLLQGPLVLYALITDDGSGTGHLALVMQALVFSCALPWAIGRAALPVLSRGSASGGNDSQQTFASHMMRLAFVLAAAMGLAGMTIGPTLVAGVFGAGYADAGTLLGPALWLLLPLTVATALNPLLMAREWYGAAGVSALAGATVMTVLVSLASINLGPLGAIAGAAGGSAVWALCLIYIVVRQFGVAVHRAAVRPAVAAVAGLTAHHFMAAVGAGPLFSLAVVWPALFLAVLFLSVAPTERHALGAVVTRLWHAVAEGRR